MNENEKRPGCSEHPGRHNSQADSLSARSRYLHTTIDAQPLSTPLRPRPAIFVAFDETALKLAEKQLRNFVDITFWDTKLGPAGMPLHRGRFLFEWEYNLIFFYPCNPKLRETLNRHPRTIAMPPMPTAEMAAAPMGLKFWLLCHWPKELRSLRSREAVYVHN